MTTLPYVNPAICHQVDQQPAFAPDGSDGTSLYDLVSVITRLHLMDFDEFWDSYEIWRNRKRWLSEVRSDSKRLKGSE